MATSSNIIQKIFTRRGISLTIFFHLEIKYWLILALKRIEFKHLRTVDGVGNFTELHIQMYRILGLFCITLRQKLYFERSSLEYFPKKVLLCKDCFKSQIIFDLLFWRNNVMYLLERDNFDFSLHILDCR